MEFSPKFTGDVKNDTDVHDFIKKSLPRLSAAFHEELTAFLLHLDLNPPLTPESENLLNDRTDVQAVVTEFILAKFSHLPGLIKRFHAQCIHDFDQIESYVYRIAPDVPKEQRMIVTNYIQRKCHSSKIASEYDAFVKELSSRRPEIRDVILFLTHEMTAEKFIELYGDVFRDESEDLSE